MHRNYSCGRWQLASAPQQVTPEGRIQKKAIEYAKKLGFLAKRHYNGPGAQTGWPDVQFFLPGGRTLHIEFKAPGKEATAIQQYRIDALRQLGHEAIVCDSYEDAKAALDAAGSAVL